VPKELLGKTVTIHAYYDLGSLNPADGQVASKPMTVQL
jgi:hypothetical protein